MLNVALILRLLGINPHLPPPCAGLLFQEGGCAKFPFSAVGGFLDALAPRCAPKSWKLPRPNPARGSCSPAKSSPNGRSDCRTLHPSSTNYIVLVSS